MTGAEDLPSSSVSGVLLKRLEILQFCSIQELLSDQELPHLWIEKLETFPHLVSYETSDCIANILFICFQVFGL